jgi:hypothetical protein
LVDLGLADHNDPFTGIIAKEVIHVVSLGIDDPAAIRARVLGVLDKGPPTETG